jgi:hypothetical protein
LRSAKLDARASARADLAASRASLQRHAILLDRGEHRRHLLDVADQALHRLLDTRLLGPRPGVLVQHALLVERVGNAPSRIAPRTPLSQS